jgi:hypothetical protein
MQPANQSICAAATLSVTASGSSTLSYVAVGSTFGGVYGNVSGGSGSTATYITHQHFLQLIIAF